MIRWEYEILLHDPSKDTLNDWGRYGWELVAVTPEGIYLKRPIVERDPEE